MNRSLLSNRRDLRSAVVRPRLIPRAPARIAAYWDLENLLATERDDRDEALALIAAIVHRVQTGGVLVSNVACCDRTLTTEMAVALSTLGMRVFPHRGGVNAADETLINRIEHERPASVDTVVIGSGDHIFADVTRRLRAQGLRVVAVARPGKIAAELYVAVDEYLEVLTIDEAFAVLPQAA